MTLDWQADTGANKLSRVSIGEHPVRQMRSADDMQAAYFRAELETVRQTLLDDAVKRRALIDRPREVGRPGRPVSVEAQLRHIEWLMDRLDRRFPDGTAETSA
jgi:hypothetical protein